MASLVNELINVLDEQAQHFKTLIDLSEAKKQVIIENDLKGLQDITSQENAVIGKNQRLDKMRIGLIKDIASVLNKKEADLTLSALAEFLKGTDEQAKMSALAKELHQSITALKQINDQNSVLIKNALDYIEFSTNVMLTSVQATPATYSRNGEAVDTGRSMFDAKQ